jgi:DNA-binding NarL/FixJ family response regulator
VLTTIPAARLGAALNGVLAGEAAIPRDLTAGLLAHLLAADGHVERAAPRLSAREAEVLQALRAGRSTADIAGALGLSAVTVRRHVSSLRRKLGARDRSDLAALTPGPGAPPPPPPGSGWPRAA